MSQRRDVPSLRLFRNVVSTAFDAHCQTAAVYYRRNQGRKGNSLMKKRETNNGASKKASAGGRKDGNGKVGEFSVLPKSAGLKQSVAYMLLHIVAITRSMRVDLGSSWCLGYELTRIKAKLALKGKDWDDHCVKVVGKTSRQVRDYMVLAKAYGSAEEMIEKVGETVSFANAVNAARSRNPDPTPEPKSGKKDTGTGCENEPVTIKPDGGSNDEGQTTVVCPTAAPDSKGAEMLDDIIRIACNLAADLDLLGKVHAILVKAETCAERDVVPDKGCDVSKAKAKSRKPVANKKRGKSA